MSKNILSVPGLATPRWILWIHGWFHGHVLKSGGLDPETNIIASCYITGKCSLFHRACIARIEALESNLQKKWADADGLLVDYKELNSVLKTELPSFASVSDSIRARENERNAKIRASQAADRQAVLKKLMEIASNLRSEEHLAIDQMESTAAKLKSAFAAYGHGLLMKPIYASNLPQVTCVEYLDAYHRGHEAAIMALDMIASEIKEGI